jgi:hypothetical protein
LQDRVRTRGVETLEAALSCALEFDVIDSANGDGSRESSGQSNRKRNGQANEGWSQRRGNNRSRRAGGRQSNNGSQGTENEKPAARETNGSTGLNISTEALRAALSILREDGQPIERGQTDEDSSNARQRSRNVTTNNSRRQVDRSPPPKRFSDEKQGMYERGECFNCGKTGHKAKFCRNK